MNFNHVFKFFEPSHWLLIGRFYLTVRLCFLFQMRCPPNGSVSEQVRQCSERSANSRRSALSESASRTGLLGGRLAQNLNNAAKPGVHSEQSGLKCVQQTGVAKATRRVYSSDYSQNGESLDRRITRSEDHQIGGSLERRVGQVSSPQIEANRRELTPSLNANNWTSTMAHLTNIRFLDIV